MDNQTKLAVLKKLETKGLIEKLHECEDEFEKAMREEASFKNLNYEYLASGTSDCQAVKLIVAELSAKTPNPEEKKITIADRDAWLMRQRKENSELAAAINRQRETAFLVDNNEIAVQIAKKKLEGVKIVLELKTAQINFLAS